MGIVLSTIAIALQGAALMIFFTAGATDKSVRPVTAPFVVALFLMLLRRVTALLGVARSEDPNDALVLVDAGVLPALISLALLIGAVRVAALRQAARNHRKVVA